MILLMEARDQENALTPEEIMAKSAIEAAPRPPESEMPKPAQADAEEAGETITFDPCRMWVHYPAQVVVVQGVDMPSVVLAGWEDECPPHWSLAGRLRGKVTWPPTPLWMETQHKIVGGLCLFIAIQWFLVGGFPLERTHKWWADPGSFITACAVLAGALALIPVVNGFARVPALIAMLAWLWRFGLLVWKTLRFGWRMTTALVLPRSS